MPDPSLLLHLVDRSALEGRWERVLGLLDRLEPLLASRDPEALAFSLYQRGCAFLGLERHEEAASTLERLVRLPGSSAGERLLLADALIRCERWDEAVRHLELGLDEAPGHAGCLCALGWTLYQMGDRAGGLDLLERAARDNPHYPPAHLDLGLIHAAEGRWASSEAHLSRAVCAAPHDPELGDLLEAVRENQAQAAREKRKVRGSLGRLREQRRRLRPGEALLLRRLRRCLRGFGARHVEVVLAENLWADLAAALPGGRPLDPSWGAAATLAALRLNGRSVPRREVARAWEVSVSCLDRRHRRLRSLLGLAAPGSRYCAKLERLPADRAGDSFPRAPAAPGHLIPVDFLGRRRLPHSDACPCGSGLAASHCDHPPAPGP